MQMDLKCAVINGSVLAALKPNFFIYLFFKFYFPLKFAVPIRYAILFEAGCSAFGVFL